MSTLKLHAEIRESISEINKADSLAVLQLSNMVLKGIKDIIERDSSICDYLARTRELGCIEVCNIRNCNVNKTSFMSELLRTVAAEICYSAGYRPPIDTLVYRAVFQSSNYENTTEVNIEDGQFKYWSLYIDNKTIYIRLDHKLIVNKIKTLSSAAEQREDKKFKYEEFDSVVNIIEDIKYSFNDSVFKNLYPILISKLKEFRFAMEKYYRSETNGDEKITRYDELIKFLDSYCKQD